MHFQLPHAIFFSVQWTVRPQIPYFLLNAKEENSILDVLENKIRVIDKEVARLESIYSKLPDKKLLIVKNGNYTKWFESDGHNHIYIPKEKRRYAAQLCYRKYLQLQLKFLKSENKSLKRICEGKDSSWFELEQFLANKDNADLLKDYLKEEYSQSDLEWMNAEYEKNTAHPEHLTHETITKELVRSKSEESIYRALYYHKIPFRYECRYPDSSFIYHPDFTIKHPITGEIYYWEHLGKMDVPDYVADNMRKLSQLSQEGLIVGKNLIITCETKAHHLDDATIEQIILLYFT